MSSTVARFRNCNASQSQIVVLDISTIIKTYQGIPIPDNWNTMKSLQETRKHIYYDLKRFCGRVELNEQLAADLLTTKLLRTLKTGLVLNDCNYINLHLESSNYISASVQTESAAYKPRYSLLHVRSNNWCNVHQPL